jgi:hypothetical protein
MRKGLGSYDYNALCININISGFKYAGKDSCFAYINNWGNWSW